jgi:hypothetical protein
MLNDEDRAALSSPMPTARSLISLLPRWVWGVAAGVLALVILLWIISSLTGGESPATSVEGPSTLILDASPWGIVEEIRDAQGQAVDLAGALGMAPTDSLASRTTPLKLRLDPGKYQVSLRHETDALQTVEIDVAPGGTTSQTVTLIDNLAAEYLTRIGLSEGAQP